MVKSRIVSALLDYASSKHTAVMESIKDGEDMDPPAEPPPNAPPSEQKL